MRYKGNECGLHSVLSVSYMGGVFCDALRHRALGVCMCNRTSRHALTQGATFFRRLQFALSQFDSYMISYCAALALVHPQHRTLALSPLISTLQIPTRHGPTKHQSRNNTPPSKANTNYNLDSPLLATPSPSTLSSPPPNISRPLPLFLAGQTPLFPGARIPLGSNASLTLSCNFSKAPSFQS